MNVLSSFPWNNFKRAVSLNIFVTPSKLSEASMFYPRKLVATLRNPNKETSKTAISRGFIWLSYFPRAELVYPATGEEHPAKSFENGNLAQEWARELFAG